MTNRAGAPPLLALTLGEPGGIAPDITIEAWLRRHELGLPPFLFVGDADLLQRRAVALGRTIKTIESEPSDAAGRFANAIPCLPRQNSVTGAPGSLAQSDAEAVVASIREAVELAHLGQVAAVVTNPIQKKALNAIGFAYPGHTEFLGALGRELFGIDADPVMMLVGPDLRVVPLTVHIPLADVPSAISTERIVRTGRIVAAALTDKFASVPAPKSMSAFFRRSV